MSVAAVVTVKRVESAKQRMAAGVGDDRRRELVAAMLGDTLEAISKTRLLAFTLVVTGDPDATRQAGVAGIEVVHDPDDSGHPEAAVLGATRAAELGAGTVILLPGDCPLLEPREIDGLLTGLPDRFVTVVPDRHGSGTNALVLRPPDAIRPAFGPDSCARHVAAAREAGVPFAVEKTPSLGLDLDTPADIVALTMALEMGSSRGTRTARVLGI